MMACVPVMNEQERPNLNGNSARNHSAYKCNHIFYCAAVASRYTQPITINQELTSLLLIIWGGTTLFSCPRKSLPRKSIKALIKAFEIFIQVQEWIDWYRDHKLASNLFQNRGDQTGATLEGEDRHHFQRWPSLISPKINGCISLVAPRVPATASPGCWCSGRSSRRGRQEQAEHFSGIQGARTPFPAQPPAACESLGSCSRQQSRGCRLWAKKYQDNMPEIERERHSEVTVPGKQGRRGEIILCSTWNQLEERWKRSSHKSFQLDADVIQEKNISSWGQVQSLGKGTHVLHANIANVL